jgi:hypothetical protein
MKDVFYSRVAPTLDFAMCLDALENLPCNILKLGIFGKTVHDEQTLQKLGSQ